MANGQFPGQRPEGWTPPDGAKTSGGGCGKALAIGLAVVIGLGVLGSLLPESKKGAESDGSLVSGDQAVTEDAESNQPASEEARSAWVYSSEKDEMRGSETRYAQVEATNTIDLDFPYGEQRGVILVRQSPKFGFDILVGVPNGQVMCNAYTNSHVNVKFDDGPIRRYGCTDASDGSSNMVFIQGAKGFLAKLRASKKVVVEAEFFQNGMQQMVFDTANLEWEN